MKRLLFLSLSTIFAALQLPLKAQNINIDLSDEYQTVRGFGGMIYTTWVSDLNDDTREKAFGNKPGEIGLSILRIHVDPDSSNFKREIPSAKFAEEKGAIVFATPWNAPANCLDPFSSKSRVDPAKYPQYVNHLNSFNTYMEQNGAPLYAISVQNEPDYGDWTQWTGPEMLDFVKHFAQGINNKVIAPESFQFRRAYTDPLLTDDTAAANIEIVGGHIYGGGLMDYPLAREKGKDVWMTEHLFGSNPGEVNDWNSALTMGKEINDCMKANFNAYVWWYIRRFYGLIGDDGKITDKGYTMSQYSKFVRNGAIRVGVDDSAASQVEVTAYKTDTTLVIEVVNLNSTSVDLNFNIQNANVDKLTQITSSDTKKMVNDGELTISGGAVSAIVDARSITTFTSNAADAGKADNIKPVANAGNDITVDDTDGTGSAVVTLNGKSSSDSDGYIVNYSWSKDGTQISWDATTDVTFTIGEYDLVLTVTDNDGATDSDTVHVSFTSTKSDEIWLEAECGTVGLNWQNLYNADASNERYVETIAGHQSLDAASTSADDLIEYNFTTTETGSFKIWGRVITPTADDDSYWVKLDDNAWVMWNSIPGGSSWHWDDVHDSNNGGEAVVYQLEPGDHTLSVCMREDGAQLDKWLISNTGTTPDGMGGEAQGCTNAINFTDANFVNVNIYPNPSEGNIHVECNYEFNRVEVYSELGQLFFTRDLNVKIKSTQLSLKLDPGFYYVRLANENNTETVKILIK